MLVFLPVCVWETERDMCSCTAPTYHLICLWLRFCASDRNIESSDPVTVRVSGPWGRRRVLRDHFFLTAVCFPRFLTSVCVCSCVAALSRPVQNFLRIKSACLLSQSSSIYVHVSVSVSVSLVVGVSLSEGVCGFVFVCVHLLMLVIFVCESVICVRVFVYVCMYWFSVCLSLLHSIFLLIFFTFSLKTIVYRSESDSWFDLVNTPSMMMMIQRSRFEGQPHPVFLRIFI